MFYLFLYRLNSRIGNPAMQAIPEEDHGNDEQPTQRATSVKRIQQKGKKTHRIISTEESVIS